MEFNVEPYWDDFEATNGALENNYMRILFRPGYAVQARELTQLQTILQNQIKQFGDHIFKDGSPVIGGHLTIDSGVTYLKLEAQDPAGQDIDLENFLGVTVFNSGAPKTRAKVIQTYDTSSDRTLIIRYLRGSGFTAGQTISTAAGFSANVATGTFTGTGSTVSINEGVFYVNGFFVTVQPQTIVLDPYSSTPTYRVGLEIDEEIITESVDNALLDPAQESFNYQAPGAHRYQFSLNLAKRTIDSIDDSRFFELLRVENGVITKQVSYPIYSELEKTLARRTYDESGNYEVKPFLVDVSANTVAGSTGNANTFIVNVQPGKAYVKGFEFETIGTTKLASDRARTSTTRKDYNLSLYYGNRVYLSNVQGSATAGLGVSYSALNEVDIHCVAANTVDLTGISANYYSTRIGTAKIRNLDRLTGDTYQLYLTDMDFSPIVATANATTNTTAIKFPPNFSASPNAYQNCIITIVNNFGSNGNVAKITSYDGTNRTAFINPPIKTAMLRGATFSLTIPPEFAESIISANSGFTGANLQANIALGSPSRDPLGNTVYEDATLDTMLYKIPNFYVKYDSDKSVDFFRRILKSTVNFTVNGAATITLTGSDGVLDFGSDGALVSSAERSENIIVVAKTGANAGKIIDMTLGTRSAYRTDSATLTLYTSNGSGTAFDGDIYLTTKLNNANGIARRVKTLVQSNSAITAGDTLSSASAVTGYSDIKINASNGTIWFTSSNVVNKVPGEQTSLFLSDVVKINRIYDSGSISYAPNTTNKTDITDRYIFNSGQTDSYYDHASITLKPGENPPSGQTVVFVDYYTHTGTGYISQKSYANSVYDSEQIPVYKSQTGQLYYLRDCIDMRPLRVSGLTANPYKAITLGPTGNVAANGYVITANTARSQNVLTPPLITGSIVRINNEDRIVDKIDNPTQIRVTRPFNSACTNGSIQLVVENIQLTGGVVQRPTDSMELDYEYYLPRIDRVVATKDKEFKLIQGVPSLTPTPPLEPEDSMSICTMDLPPYTASLKSINIKHIENRRYTMKDIAIIDKRVAQLEDYVRLKESEKNIITDPPKSPETPNINKPIYGTIVDEFNDMTVTDTSPSAEFSAAVEKGLLTCAKLIKAYSLEPTKWSSGDKLFMLGYSETPFVSQPLYSNTAGEVVQSGIIAKFEGFATLSPERDYFYSQTFLPVLGDTSGRYVEPPTTLEPPVIPDVPSTPGTGPVPVPLPNLPYLDPNYTGNIVVDIGANNYTDTVYNEPVLVGDRLPTRRSIVVDIPHWTTQPQISILPQYIDYTETLNVAPITSSNSYVSVNIAATPDTITTSNLTAFNLASIGLAVGGFLAIGQNVGIQDGREERFIKFIDPTGSFIQVDTNFTANLTSANLANVGIIETFTPTVETQTVTYEPVITQQISLDFTSMMPLTYLDDIWAPPLVEPVPPVEYPMPVFAPGWLQETITAPSVDTGFDQIFNAQPDAAPTPETDFNFNFGDFGYWNFDNFYYGS